jgi:hypothetical protein
MSLITASEYLPPDFSHLPLEISVCLHDHDGLLICNIRPGAGGSCISVASAVTAWKQLMEPAKSLKDKMYLGSPAVTNGVNGMGLDWLRDFMRQCNECSIDFICLHW